MGLFLNIFSIVLLGVVAGFLLAVWYQLRDWKASMKQSPLLAEQLAEQLMSARRGLDELRKGLISHGPELSTLLSEGGKMRVELQLLLQRAEEVALKLDGKPRGAGYSATIEQVAGANGKAVQPTQVAHDPLEALLAGLNEEPLPETQIKPSRRRGPVTQAELDLQHKVMG